MEDYQLRVVEEKKELDIKIEKLENYIEKTTNCDGGFSLIDTKSINIMQIQLEIMKSYSTVLRTRIHMF